MKRYLILLAFPVLLLFSGCGEKDEPTGEVITGAKFYYITGSTKNGTEVREHHPEPGADKLIAEIGKKIILDMQINEKQSHLFLVVYDRMSTAGLFPVLRGAKLLLVETGSGNIKELSMPERCVQIYTQWNDNNNYSVTINSKAKEGEFIIQTEMVINTNGETVFRNDTRYDVLKEGYPGLPAPKVFTASSLGKVNLIIDRTEPLSLTFVDPGRRMKRTILKSEGRLRQAEWMKSDSLVVFSVQQKEDQSGMIQSSVYLFSTDKADYLKKWSGAGEKFFKITGDYLIFDNQIRNSSEITIYDLRTGKEFSLHSGGNPVSLKKSPGILN